MCSKASYIIIGSLLLFGFWGKSQSTPYFLLNAGYQNLDGNYGTVGGSLYLVQQNDDVLSFSLMANMGYMKDHFILVPEGNISYTFSGKDKAPYKDIDASFFKASLSATPYAIQPKVGISILNLWDVYAGYSFQFREYEYTSFDGILIGTTLSIPIL